MATPEITSPELDRQKRLCALVQAQQDTAQSVRGFLKGSVGATFLSGRTVEISSGPRDFLLTIDDGSSSCIFFRADEFDSNPDSTKVRTKYTLSHLRVDEKTGRSTTTYRFNESSTHRGYKNGQAEIQVSEMTDEDFTKASGLLETINGYFDRPN